MGLHAAVFYGYDLGTEEDHWTFVTYNDEDYRYNWPEWMELDDGEDPDEPVTQMEDRIFAHLSPFNEIEDYSKRPDDYYPQLYKAKADLGIKSGMYGTDSWSGYVLGFEIVNGYDGVTFLDKGVFDIDFTFMDAKLRAAKEVLGVEFEGQPEPQLMIIASHF